MPAKHHINYAFFLVKVLCEPWLMQNNQEILLKRWYIFKILRHERPFELSSQGYYRVIRNPQSLKVLNGSRIVSIHHKLQIGKKKMLQKITIFDEAIKIIYLVVVQLLSHVRIFATPWTAAHRVSLSFNISWSLLKLMSTESVILSNHLILLPLTFHSIRVFSNELTCIRWPKYWSFSFIIIPSNEYSGLISFRVDWFHLLALHGTFKSLLQHCSSKASIL